MLPQADHPWTLYEAAHLLNRAGFGGSPSEIEKLHALGREKAVDHLLTATDSPDAFPTLEWASAEYLMASLRERFAERRELVKQNKGASAEESEKIRREAFKAIQEENRRHALEGQRWWFDRMLSTAAPLREKMTLFWHDHFATSLQKVKQPALMIRQNELFRSHALGSFKELTHAMVLDPAMMLYLDTQNSRKGKPNENFAREVMELFTLGEGNYTENDIREAARAFTGYDLQRFTGRVEHSRKKWDETPKTIFGKTGPYNGAGVVDLIFEKPESASFIAKKIWEFFVYDSPAPKAIQSMAETLVKNDYRVEPLLREIFLSREFYSEPSIRSQIKCPVQFIIQLLKQLEIKDTPLGFPILAQQQLGQTLFLPPNVAGWDWGKAWINTNTLLARYNLAGFITKGTDDDAGPANEKNSKVPAMGKAKLFGKRWSGPDYEAIAPRALRDEPSRLIDSLSFRFFQGPIPDKARGSFIEYANAKKGLVFTNKEIAELCHLMLSTPYYQLC